MKPIIILIDRDEVQRRLSSVSKQLESIKIHNPLETAIVELIETFKTIRQTKPEDNRNAPD